MNDTFTGLSDDDVRRFRQLYGANEFPEKKPPGSIALAFGQLKNPLVYVLLAAACVTILIGHLSDAVIILVAVVINTALGVFQEQKAGRALAALKHYLTHSVTVIRGGRRETVPARHLVPGDIVLLNPGERVPADGILMKVNRLYIEESVLTGESMPAEKHANGQVFMGTTVSAGQGTMKISAIGPATRMGSIAREIQTEEAETPLERQLRGFSRQLVTIIIGLTVLVFAVGLLHRVNIADIFVTSVALAVSAIPEGLLVSLTVILAIGMQKILARRGLVRRLTAAETLGSVTVICVDKTGTLTEGTMQVVDAVGNVRHLALQAVLANDLDDPIVIAAYEWARKERTDASTGNHRLDSIPFTSKNRYFASLHTWTNGKTMLFVNGAPEMLLGWTTLSQKEQEEIRGTIEALTQSGKRAIGFARKECRGDTTHIGPDDAKNGLIWVGLLAFSDRVRGGVKDALAEAHAAGIRTVVITGDYPATSVHILRELGLPVRQDELLTGTELAKLSGEALAETIDSVRLFARTTPDQKLRIVEALKQRGEVVAMTGDGVNDAPALHSADIGIVVGEATDVAKESADLVLLDSNFATIIAAVEEGRAMFENIRKVILYLMSDAFAEIAVVLGGILLGLPLPVTAVQILWVNLVSDGFPGLSLTVDPARGGIMREHPRPTGEPIVNHAMLTLISLVSVVAGLLALGSFIAVLSMTGNRELARSVTFIILGLNSLSYVFSVRLLMRPFWRGKLFENRWLIGAVAAGLILQVVPFLLPELRAFFGVTALPPFYWVLAASLSVVMFFVVEACKLLYQVPCIYRRIHLPVPVRSAVRRSE